MAQHPFDLPIDPTPTWPTLRDRLSCAIERIEACVEGGEELTGPERIAVARVLNAYATPLICALRSLTTRPPPAA